MKNWDKVAPYFTKKEFACKWTGKENMDEEFMLALFSLRKAYNKPMVITSGYRDVDHPAERKKVRPGSHTMGLAADILCTSTDAYQIVSLAMAAGFEAIGVSQAPQSARFVHLEFKRPEGFPSPVLFSY